MTRFVFKTKELCRCKAVQRSSPPCSKRDTIKPNVTFPMLRRTPCMTYLYKPNPGPCVVHISPYRNGAKTAIFRICTRAPKVQKTKQNQTNFQNRENCCGEVEGKQREVRSCELKFVSAAGIINTLTEFEKIVHSAPLISVCQQNQNIQAKTTLTSAKFTRTCNYKS